MKRLFSCAAPVAAFLLANCGPSEEPSASTAAMPIPENICSQAREGLSKLAADGTVEYTHDGRATIQEVLWLQMSSGAKDALAQALGVVAACNAQVPPKEQEITISSEWGSVLMRRIVPVSNEIGLEM